LLVLVDCRWFVKLLLGQLGGFVAARVNNNKAAVLLLLLLHTHITHTRT
jgi:hypothetical protein